MENIRMNLRLFDANTQVTTQQSLTEEMKTFYPGEAGAQGRDVYVTLVLGADGYGTRWTDSAAPSPRRWPGPRKRRRKQT